MKTGNRPISRKKFALWGLGLLSLFAIPRLPFFNRKPPKQSGTVKMLAQDGTLVEVDASVLNQRSRKVTDTELQNWVKK